MEIVNRDRSAPFTTKDGSEIRSILDRTNSSANNQSLAEATLPPGTATEPHHHPHTEEIYHILRGIGRMTLGIEQRDVQPGDGILIPPGTRHTIRNTLLTPFYDRPNVEKYVIPIGPGVPLGLEAVNNSRLGIGGVYGSWGQCYDNTSLPALVAERMGHSLDAEDVLNLSELGFDSRQHIPTLSPGDHLQLELEIGSRLLKRTLQTCGWDASKVQGVLIGVSGPVSSDYVSRISQMAGIPNSALKVSVHKACDGSMGALHLALNAELSQPGQLNIAERLRGKKVLVGGIEGFSRFVSGARDKNALQLFGNGMGVIGVVPGETMKLLVGRSFENYDEEGLLAVRMSYPHSRPAVASGSLIDIAQDDENTIRIAGLMNEPKNGESIEMAGLMGMVKLFVRTGVQVVEDVCREYQVLMDRLGQSGKSI